MVTGNKPIKINNLFAKYGVSDLQYIAFGLVGIWTFFLSVRQAGVLGAFVLAEVMAGVFLGLWFAASRVFALVLNAQASALLMMVFALSVWLEIDRGDHWRVALISSGVGLIVLLVVAVGWLTKLQDSDRELVRKMIYRKKEDLDGLTDAEKRVGERGRNILVNSAVLAGIIATWVGYSAFYTWREATSVAATASAPRTTEMGFTTTKVKVGLALSGGGYRAALMHAGVVSELKSELGRLGIPISHVSTVSGGSIIGAFIALGGSPEAFRDLVVQGHLNLTENLFLIHNIIRLPFPLSIAFTDSDGNEEVKLFPWYEFNRLDVQANLIGQVLYGGAKFDAVRKRGDLLLQICATDLKRGFAVGLSSEDIIEKDLPYVTSTESGKVVYEKPRAKILRGVSIDSPISRIVAASGAFPGAFNALKLELPAAEGASGKAIDLLLGDGGLTDNLGVDLLLERHNADPAWHLDMVIVSDGGAALKNEHVSRVGELSRALDIVYAGSGWRPISDTNSRSELPIIFLQPPRAKFSSLNPTAHEEKLARLLKAFQETSTLTDRFTKQQADSLFELGQELVKEKREELQSILMRIANTTEKPN